MTATSPPPALRADRSALLFPTGGYLWPGMGADLAGSPYGDVVERADRALARAGVPGGALAALMAGAGQIRRARLEDRWGWTGDFPLSMVAQTVLGIGLARAFLDAHGAPAALAGESMGELAAYAVAGVLSPEDAVLLTYRWARDLQAASDELGLRMAVVEELDETAIGALPPELGARVVVSDGPRLHVVGAPAVQLDALDREVRARGGSCVVSNNPCAAHEARLAGAGDVWSEHARAVAALDFAPATLPLRSTLVPGEPLADPAALRENRIATTFTVVRWGDTLATLPALGVRHLVQLGPPSSTYPARRLRADDARLAGVQIHAASSLAAVRALPAPPPRAPS